MYRHVVSKEAFGRIDHFIFAALWSWCKRRHPKKSGTWIKKKYFRTIGKDKWAFATSQQADASPLVLVKAKRTPIRRHIKIKAAANPYDPMFSEYFQWRVRKRHP